MNKLKPISIPEERIFDGRAFPLTVGPSDDIKSLSDAIEFVKANTDSIQTELKAHGAILFRDFPIQSAQGFNEFVLAFGWKDLPYIGGAAVRSNVCGVVFTANEGPADIPIVFHHEMAHMAKFPSALFFYCEVEPHKGGQTQFCLSNQVYNEVRRRKPEFMDRLENKMIKYVRILPDHDDPSSLYGRGWKSTFLTEEKQKAELKIKSGGDNFEWLANNVLKVSSQLKTATRVEHITQKSTWFNSIVPFYCGINDSKTHHKLVTFGDDTPIEAQDAHECHQIMEELSVAVDWKKNDVILVDNMLVLHARKIYQPPRRILAALFE